jgi:hypothetical protein
MLHRAKPKSYSGIRSTIADIIIEMAESGDSGAWVIIQQAQARKRKAQSNNTTYYELEENEKADCMEYLPEYLKWELRRYFTANSLFNYIAWKERKNPFTFSNGSTIYQYWDLHGINENHRDKNYHDQKSRGAALFLEGILGKPISKRRWNTRKALKMCPMFNTVHRTHKNVGNG